MFYIVEIRGRDARTAIFKPDRGCQFPLINPQGFPSI
jgi:hypothetical protein